MTVGTLCPRGNMDTLFVKESSVYVKLRVETEEAGGDQQATMGISGLPLVSSKYQVSRNTVEVGRCEEDSHQGSTVSTWPAPGGQVETVGGILGKTRPQFNTSTGAAADLRPGAVLVH